LHKRLLLYPNELNKSQKKAEIKSKQFLKLSKKRVQSYIIYRDFSPYSKIYYSYEVKIISNTFVGSIDIKT